MTNNLVNKSNEYLANVGVSYIKLHNLHWNVVGFQFKAVHEYLESLYDSLADVLDEVAEIIKMNGAMPLGSLKSYLEVATIKELDDADVSCKDALAVALGDIKVLKAQADEVRSLADAEGNYSLVAMMEDHVENYNKTIWFVESMLK